jgi:hypothetical protein
MPEIVAENPTRLSPSERDLKPLTVTIAAARRISGLGNTTIWGLIRDGKLDTSRIGRRRLVVYQSLEKLLTSSAATVGSHKASSRKL